MPGCRFLKIFIVTYFQCSFRGLIFAPSCYCTIFALHSERFSEVENYYYTGSINGKMRLRWPEVHLHKSPCFGAQFCRSNLHKDLKRFVWQKTALNSLDYLKPLDTLHITNRNIFNTWIETDFQSIGIMQRIELQLL